MSWEIQFYETPRGERPVEIFMDDLDISTRTKTARAVKLLAQYGSRLTMPHSKKVSSKLFELRIRGVVELRIFYTFLIDEVYLLHMYQKKSQKLPKRELEVARSRLKLLN
jgi:phage-related protein